MHIVETKKRAVFFTLDKTIRRLRTVAAQDHVSRFGMAPPVPVALGEQELIMPVILHIKKMCEERKAVPILLDMAPYISTGQLSLGQYEEILQELKEMLGDVGLTNVRAYTCVHAPKEIPIVDPSGRGPTRYEYKPACSCRFPNPGLIQQACQEQNIAAGKDKFGNFRVMPPSIFIGSSQDEREASIMRANMSFIWAGAILDGSIDWENQIDHTHLKAAREIQKEAKKLGNRLGSKIELHQTVAEMLPKGV